jgi:hypothetical protein
VGPRPDTLSDGGRDDAAVAEVVEFAANPEQPPTAGECEIAIAAAAEPRRTRGLAAGTGSWV